VLTVEHMNNVVLFSVENIVKIIQDKYYFIIRVIYCVIFVGVIICDIFNVIICVVICVIIGFIICYIICVITLCYYFVLLFLL